MNLTEAIKKIKVKFSSNDDLKIIFNSSKDKQIILLGEASHGTSEYYKTRAKLSKQLFAKYEISHWHIRLDV